MERRLDKLPENPARDAANMAVAQRVERAYQQAAADLASAGRAHGAGASLAETRWMLEELRVSLFAQTLGTQAPVSENRVLAALDRLSA
jgi:ATP-dependent helicase HrpA